MIGSMIPVSGVSNVSFLAVEVGMEPGPMGIGEILCDIMSPVPIPCLGQPKNLKFRG